MEQLRVGGTKPPVYFVCYDRVDIRFVDKIEVKFARRARQGELAIWIDRRNLDVGTTITPEIEVVLGEAAGAIVLVSDEFLRLAVHPEHRVAGHQQPLGAS